MFRHISIGYMFWQWKFKFCFAKYRQKNNKYKTFVVLLQLFFRGMQANGRKFCCIFSYSLGKLRCSWIWVQNDDSSQKLVPSWMEMSFTASPTVISQTCFHIFPMLQCMIQTGFRDPSEKRLLLNNTKATDPFKTSASLNNLNGTVQMVVSLPLPVMSTLLPSAQEMRMFLSPFFLKKQLFNFSRVDKWKPELALWIHLEVAHEKKRNNPTLERLLTWIKSFWEVE